MVVEVRLFATFRKGRFLLLLNGQYACGQDKLAPDDVVSIFPLMGGG
jgi:molybdopterin converting factor small subunit